MKTLLSKPQVNPLLLRKLPPMVTIEGFRTGVKEDFISMEVLNRLLSKNLTSFQYHKITEEIEQLRENV